MSPWSLRYIVGLLTYCFSYDMTLPCFYNTPTYLAEHGYQNPIDPKNGIFQYAKDYKGSIFDFFAEHPKEGATFNNMMGGVMARQAGMLDIYPFAQLDDTQPIDSSTPLLVDVGGGVGQDINKFLAQQPALASRLLLQDLPEVVKLAKCPRAVRVMAHDFSTPQPVRGELHNYWHMYRLHHISNPSIGARAYYAHGVFHDWSDEPARQILGHLRDAMSPGYSRLLIHDHVLPTKDFHPHATGYDLAMMVTVSAFERTEPMWTELLDSVGLRVVKIWSSPLATQSVIEAELV